MGPKDAVLWELMMPLKDPEARKAYQKEYAQRNKAYARVKEWRAANPDARKKQEERYAKKHPDLISEKRKRWRANNLDAVKLKERLASKKVREEKRDVIKVRKAEYAKRNKYIVNAACSKRKASKLLRTPKWVGQEELWLIKEAYELSQLRTKLHGFSWHVDHVIPLQGELVSGLHVPKNLQVIPALENIQKNNRYEIA